MLILIVEDDTEISDTYQDALESAGYTCEAVTDGGQASELLAKKAFDLLLLDIELPGKSGLELLQETRRRNPQQPVLLITARSDVQDRIEGLDLGADDYLVKPVALDEMMARIRTVLRRAHGGDVLSLRVDDLTIDVANRRVERSGNRIELTNREFELLEYMARRVGETVSYEELAREVWQHSDKATPINNLVAAHMSHLREKLDTKGALKLIHTVWGKGFRLARPEDESES